MNKKTGFTLVEMMVTVAILAILMTLAVPSYQRLVVDSRMTTQSNELLTTIYFTRSEAVKRNATVSACKSSNGTSCANGGTWAQGWIVFVDAGTAGTRDDFDNEPLLRVRGALDGATTLVGKFGVGSYFSYLSSGQSSPATGRFHMCSPYSEFDGRDIRLNIGGRPTVTTDTPPLTCG